jgi:hypothetical protein
MQMHRIINGYQSGQLNERVSITSNYIIVQKEMTFYKMKIKFSEIFDKLSFDYKIPHIEELEDSM